MAYLKKNEILEQLRASNRYLPEHDNLSRAELLKIFHGNVEQSADVNTTQEVTEETVSNIPPMHSPQWTAYVHSKFQDNELINNAPTCDGLRRVFEEVLGPIISVNANVLLAPRQDNNNRAAVTVTIKYRKWNDVFREQLEVTDGADVCNMNTDRPYCNYPVATAITTAEGRCLKKALRLVKVLTAEEKQGSSDETKITSDIVNNSIIATTTQKNIILQLADKNKIDIIKLMTLMTEDLVSKDMEALTYSDAQKLITRLGLYNRTPDDGGLVIPETIFSN